MKARKWIPLVFCALAIGLLADAKLLAKETSEGRVAKGPNIVFIYADDHSEAAIGCYGSKMNLTPNIDKLAKQGMRFTNSFVGNSICGPARATILTGLHSHANGKLDNRAGFNQDLPTFAKTLQAKGYATAMIGKWHIRTDPVGFDYWETIGGGYYNPTFKTADGPLKTTGYVTDIITDHSIDWMKKQSDAGKPFVAWISHSATHRTWMPATRHLKNYDDQKISQPKTLFDDYKGRNPGAASAQTQITRDMFPAYDLKLPVTGEGFLDGSMRGKLNRMTQEQRTAWHEAYGPKNAEFAKKDPKGKALTEWKYQRYIKDYLRCVDAIDENVGKVMTFLEKEGIEDNTILIYSSDQGFFLGEHGWYDKRWMYEPSLRTPLIVKWPGVIKQGSTCSQLVQNIDMSPTFLEMTGQAVPKSMHGASLVPLLKSEKVSEWRKGIYYHYHMKEGPGRASHLVARHYGIRTDRYKLIHVYDHQTWELYDLQSDPDEMKNLYPKRKDDPLVAQLKSQLKRLRKKFRDEHGPAVE